MTKLDFTSTTFQICVIAYRSWYHTMQYLKQNKEPDVTSVITAVLTTQTVQRICLIIDLESRYSPFTKFVNNIDSNNVLFHFCVALNTIKQTNKHTVALCYTLTQYLSLLLLIDCFDNSRVCSDCITSITAATPGTEKL